MFDYIRLQFKLKWGLNRNNSKRSAILTTVAVLIAVGVGLALVWGLAYVLKLSLVVSAKRLFVLFLTVIVAGLTVFATGMQIKRLYQPADLKITARFPLSSFKIFVSSLILNYIDLSIYSTILLVPIMLVFGWATSCINFVFICGMILGVVFLPMIPFALSIFIALPIMYLNMLLKKHNIIQLILFIVFLAGLFILYYFVLTALAKFFIYKNWEAGTLAIWQSVLSALDSPFNPAYYLGNIIFFDHFWLGLGVLIGATLLLTSGGVLLAKVIYQKIRTNQLNGISAEVKRNSKIDGKTCGRAILRHTFLEILHTKTYSYFYLGVAISTPVMVFFCDRLVGLVGQSQIGQGINFGVSILVVAVFMAMISSFSATILSIEGKNFYITKIVPVSYRKQLLLKGFINIAVSIGALLVSLLVLVALKFVNITEMIVLLVSQVLFVIGLVFNSLNMNLANPNIRPKANGEADEINITFMLLLGLLVAVVFGVAGLLLPKFLSFWAYLVIVGVGIVYSLINFLVFWFTANKKYNKIEA